jgi:hypothetical protein
MSFDLSLTDTALGIAVTLCVVALFLGVGRLVTWFLSHRD